MNVRDEQTQYYLYVHLPLKSNSGNGLKQELLLSLLQSFWNYFCRCSLYTFSDKVFEIVGIDT